MDAVIQDIRYAARQLARTPGFTLIVLATLSLAVGATTAVFSLVNGVLLSPLGFVHSDRLVFLQGTDARGATMTISPQDLTDYRNETHSFTDVVAVEGGRNVNLVRPSAPALRVNAARVGATFFTVLGVDAELGRTFAVGEDSRAAPKVVVLSDGGWKRYFGGDPHIIGRQVMLNGDVYVVVGIAPPRFSFPDAPVLWYPAVWADDEIGDASRGLHSIWGIARLRDGVTLISAQHDLSAVASRIAAAFPKNDAGISAAVLPLHQQIVGSVEAPLWAMLGAVGFVLLIACANVANLLLVRSTSRASEVAVRTALGARRPQLIRQFLTESMLLGFGGAIGGTILAVIAVHTVTAPGVIGLPRIDAVTIDARVLAFSAVLAVATGLAFGLLPALHAQGWDLARVLRSGTRGASARRGHVRSAFVLAQLAMGTVLLIGAGLLIRSFDRLTHVDPGFRSDHLAVFDVALSGEKYQYDAGLNGFADQVQAGLAALPGVQSVAVAANRPFDANPSFAVSAGFTIDGTPPPTPGTGPESRILPVSPSFFPTMGMTLVRGRVFRDDENRLEAAPVVVINQALAARYFPGQDPIGKHLTFALAHNVTAVPSDTVRARGEIVGIVRDAYYGSLSRKPGPATFFPYRLLPFGATFLVHTAIEGPALEREIRAVVAAVDPDVPAYEVGTMRQALAESVSQSRFYTELLAAFAAVALLLATLGVYGVVSYTVSQQTRDFGIRLALGARSRDVVRLVLGRGASLIVPGLTVGVLSALFLTRVIRGLLFGIEPFDAPTLAFVCLLFAIVGTAASWVPARRAARVDPIIAMRAEGS